MNIYRITVVKAKSKYRYLAFGFKSSSDALLNAMRMLQGGAPKVMKVEVVK